MKRMWVRIGRKRFCVPAEIATCFQAHFLFVPRDSDSDPELERATGELNQILDELIAGNPDPNRELGIIAVTKTDNGEDQLVLSWISTDEEVELSGDCSP